MKRTILAALADRVETHPERPALRHKRRGEWRDISWSGYQEAVGRAGRGLMALGLEPGEGVGILGFNRPEWFVSALGAVAAGGLPAGLYTTLKAEQCRYIADHCEAGVVVVENREQLEKILSVRARLPRLRALVLMEGDADEEGIHSWEELLELGDRVPEEALKARAAKLDPDDACTLIYTSGTTGEPKAVMLSHHNVLWTARAVVEQLDVRSEDECISYLPLSHIAEQMLSLYAPLEIGCRVWFAESLDRLAENLREVRPHIFFGVPRVWEKIQAGIQAAAADTSGIKKRIARWARGRGLKGGYAEQAGRSRPALYGLAERLVFSKVRRKLGLDRARICATGAAPPSRETLEFFLSLGIPILEVYGLSECSGPATLSTPERYRTGAAGFAIPGTELAIAADGEIRIRGPHVFLGYYKDDANTRETLDAEGWLHSGDIGEIDADGFLRVTDRKKELIVTSGGKNVAPQPIEAKLRPIPGIAQAVVLGDGRNYLTALLTLEPESLAEAAGMAGSPARTTEEAVACDRFRRFVQDRVDEINTALARYETIKRFALLPEPFSVESGELTPTMKLKRRVVAEKFAREIGELYARTEPGSGPDTGG